MTAIEIESTSIKMESLGVREENADLCKALLTDALQAIGANFGTASIVSNSKTTLGVGMEGTQVSQLLMFLEDYLTVVAATYASLTTNIMVSMIKEGMDEKEVRGGAYKVGHTFYDAAMTSFQQMHDIEENDGAGDCTLAAHAFAALLEHIADNLDKEDKEDKDK